MTNENACRVLAKLAEIEHEASMDKVTRDQLIYGVGFMSFNGTSFRHISLNEIEKTVNELRENGNEKRS